jgi:hypothetical protein
VVKFEPNDQSAGEYLLRASVTIDDKTYSDTEQVHMSVPASGEFKDSDDRGIYTEIRFSQNGAEQFKIVSNTDGTYEKNIRPGNYDIGFHFPEATVYLEDVDVYGFVDPMNYYHSKSDDAAPGLHVAAFFAFETTLDYASVEMKLKYDESRVHDEKEIKVYKCDSWSSGNEICYDSWEEIAGSINTVNNVVTIKDEGFSAYAIGTLKSLTIDHSLNKNKFVLGEDMQLDGLTLDAFRKKVGGVDLEYHIEGTSIIGSTKSDENGIYSVLLVAPEIEDNYEITLTAEKYPYLGESISIPFKVEKSRIVSITGPDTIKSVAGEESRADFTIENSGQSDLFGLNISLSGMSEDTYSLSHQKIDIDSGEKKEVVLIINTPEDSASGTRSVTIKVEGDGVSINKVFGFTIEDEGTVDDKKDSSPSTGFITLPDITGNTLYAIVFVVLFAAVSFSAAILLKRRKLNGGSFNMDKALNQSRKKPDNKRVLVKGELDKIKSQISISESATGAQNNIEAAWDKLKDKWASMNGGLN